MIPINDLKRHNDSLDYAIRAAIERVIDRGWYVLGPEVEGFEADFASYLGVRHCVSVGNGTDALELALRALGISAGDRVLTVANAGMYATSAILAAGALPSFVDVDEDSMLLQPADVERALETRPKAAIVTHLYGQLAPVEQLIPLLRSAGVRVMEDCAQSHGARCEAGMAGSFGDVAAFSFYPTKNLGALGDGGAIVTSDQEIAKRTRQLRQYGWISKYRSEIAGGRNSRLDEIQASVLRTKLEHLDRLNARRRRIVEYYRRNIHHDGLRFLPDGGLRSVEHLAVVRTPNRSSLAEHLRAAGITTDIHYPIPDHRQESLAKRYPGVSLPVTEDLARQILTVPCFPEMTDAEVNTVVEQCNRWVV